MAYGTGLHSPESQTTVCHARKVRVSRQLIKKQLREVMETKAELRRGETYGASGLELVERARHGCRDGNGSIAVFMIE